MIPPGRRTLPVLASFLLLAACGDRRASGVAYDGPYAPQVRKLLPKLEASTGLAFTRAPVVEMRSRDEVRGFLEREFETGRQASQLEVQGAAYRLFGLLPDSLDLKQMYLDLLTEQVAGYYDPKVKKLFLVDSQPDDVRAVTLGHELVHALQDQHFDLDSVATSDLPNDRLMATQAVIEGQATYEQLTAMLGEGFRMPGGWEMIRDQIRDNSQTMPRFAAAPFFVQEGLIFPYLSGSEFMRAFKAKYPRQSPYARMPASTEQVLHPDKLLGDSVDAPTRVRLPAPAAGQVAYRNVLGEFETRLFVFQHLQDQATAIRGAAGWDGDEFLLLRFPTGEGLVWLTVWDSAVDAGEFYQVADRSVIARFRPKTYRPLGETGKLYPDLKGRAIRVAAVTVGGRPAVLYVDVPAGVETSLLPLAKVALDAP
ncbi:MAG: hypothetical protein ACK53W_13305 [Gemmatimonadota bacterium]|nr:hypothetical protein [Gemmatimonadota bacterium]